MLGYSLSIRIQISTAVYQSVISDQFQIVNQNLFPDMNRAN